MKAFYIRLVSYINFSCYWDECSISEDSIRLSIIMLHSLVFAFVDGVTAIHTKTYACGQPNMANKVCLVFFCNSVAT